MISFDQVLLLEERVESAVKKIEQLNAENAALRAKVAELSNALNAKSEQFSSFQSDQSKIEEGILKALNRLNAVENVVLQAAAIPQPQTVQVASNQSSVPETQPASQEQKQETIVQPVFVAQQAEAQATESAIQETAIPETAVQVPTAIEALAQETVSEPSFDNMPLSENQPENFESSIENPESEPLPEEVEIPVQNIPQSAESVPESESFTPDIAFDFGDANPAQQPQVQQDSFASAPSVQSDSLDAGSADNQNQADSSEPQALFDIF